MPCELPDFGPQSDEFPDYSLSQQIDDYASVLGLQADADTAKRVKSIFNNPRSDLRLFIEGALAGSRAALGGNNDDIPPDSWEVAAAIAEREARDIAGKERVVEIHQEMYGVD